MRITTEQVIYVKTEQDTWAIKGHIARAALVLLKHSEKIEAIKFLRAEFPGMSLKDSKDLVEELPIIKDNVGLGHVPYFPLTNFRDLA